MARIRHSKKHLAWVAVDRESKTIYSGVYKDLKTHKGAENRIRRSLPGAVYIGVTSATLPISYNSVPLDDSNCEESRAKMVNDVFGLPEYKEYAVA